MSKPHRILALAALSSLVLTAPAARACGPDAPAVRRPSLDRVAFSARGGFAEAAAATGRPWTELFRRFRARGEVERVACPGDPAAREGWVVIPLGGPPLPPAGSFFQRMPMDRWHTPADGTWGVSRSGGRRRHKGIDMHAPEGEPIYTVAAGTVYRAWKSKGKERDGGYGNYVILEHDDRDLSGMKFWTYYTHMFEPPAVREGDRVPAGFRIGSVGRTPIGRFENPHLHFEVRLADGSELGKATNPTPFGVPFGAFNRRFHGGEGAF